MAEDPKDQVIANKTLNRSIRGSSEVFVKAVILVEEEAHLLTRAEFLILTARENPLSIWTTTFFAVTAGYVILVLSKYIQELVEKSNSGIEKWEYIIIIIGSLITLALFIVSKCVRSEKKKLIKKIKQHFETTPQTVRVRRLHNEEET